MYLKRVNLFNHVKEHATIYLFMLILFLTGIIFGAIIVNSMNITKKIDLFFYLERFFGELSSEHSIDTVDILKNSTIYHVKYLLLLFILGLSVIGLPVVWILLFLKGIVVGFSVGFIVNQLGLKGLLIAALSIAPQNIVIIPIYIIAGSMAMIFSLLLLNKLFTRQLSKPILKPLRTYSIVFLGLIVVSFSGALLEAFAASFGLESIIKSLY